MVKNLRFLFFNIIFTLFLPSVFAISANEELVILDPIERKYQKVIDGAGLSGEELYRLASRWLREHDISVDKAKKDAGLIKWHGNIQVGIWSGTKETPAKYKTNFDVTVEIKDEKVRFTFSEMIVQINNGIHSKHYSAKGEYLTNQAIECFAKYANEELLNPFEASVIKKQESIAW